MRIQSKIKQIGAMKVNHMETRSHQECIYGGVHLWWETHLFSFSGRHTAYVEDNTFSPRKEKGGGVRVTQPDTIHSNTFTQRAQRQRSRGSAEHNGVKALECLGWERVLCT